MIDTVIVSCRKNIYYLSPNGEEYNIKDKVVFESDEDLLVGTVIKSNYKEKKKNLDLPLFNIIRKVNKDDLKKIDSNKKIEEKALREATKISKELELDMRFADVEYTLNRKVRTIDVTSSTKSINFKITLQSGTNTLNIVAIDKAGNRNEIAKTIEI